MSSMVPPAASTAALTFSHTCRVCSVMSPMPAMLPSVRRAVMPEMNTNRPVASTAVAWEKTPLGWRSFGLEIWTFGIRLILRGSSGELVGSKIIIRSRSHRRRLDVPMGRTELPPPLLDPVEHDREVVRVGHVELAEHRAAVGPQVKGVLGLSPDEVQPRLGQGRGERNESRRALRHIVRRERDAVGKVPKRGAAFVDALDDQHHLPAVRGPAPLAAPGAEIVRQMGGYACGRHQHLEILRQRDALLVGERAHLL